MAFDPSLQIQLDELWFRLPASVINPDELARRQSWLLREFQIYARGKHGAVEQGPGNGSMDGDKLRQTPLTAATQLPPGVPHGEADGPTRAAIQAWKTARLRCPVIFEARKRLRTGPPSQWPVVSAGFIFHDQLQDLKARVFVRDYTGRQLIKPDGLADVVTVGTAIQYPKSWGIKAGKAHSFNAAISPERLCGKIWAELNTSERATFRIVVALATVESECVFDGINGYDQACVSAGPFHYTAFPGVKPFLGDAELAAFLAYFRHHNAAASDRLVGTFGLQSIKDWSIAMRNTNDRVFRSELGFVNAAGKFPSLPAKTERDWIRTWHSFYRIQYALRTSSEMQRLLWPYTRQRLSDLLATPWNGVHPPGAKTIGDVFRSERSIALLARWHVYRPIHVVSGGKAGEVPSKVVEVAGLAAKSVTSWTDDDEALIAAAFTSAADNALAMRASMDLRKTLATLSTWRHSDWSDGVAGPTLRTARNFLLDRTDIPFPPAPVKHGGKVSRRMRSEVESPSEGNA